MNKPKEYPQKRYDKPAGATDVLLIRHGQSRAATMEHPFDLVDGQGDPELSQEGEAQAECLAARLGDHPIDAIYVTNLQRTAQTAAPLAKRLRLVPQIEADLREVHLGDWEGGLFRKKVAESDPLYLKMLAEEEWGNIPGGETTKNLRVRVQVALEKIVSAHPNQTVAVICHGGVISALLSIATGSRPFAFKHVENTAINHLVVHGKEFVIRSFNDIHHLEGMVGSRST